MVNIIKQKCVPAVIASLLKGTFGACIVVAQYKMVNKVISLALPLAMLDSLRCITTLSFWRSQEVSGRNRYPIFTTVFYLILGSIILSILFPVKLLLSGVPLMKWGGEFLWLLEILLVSWVVALVMAWVYCKLRYSSMHRFIGALLFGVFSPLVILMSTTVFGYIFSGIVPSGIDTKEGQRNIMFLYTAFFLFTSGLYISVYERT